MAIIFQRYWAIISKTPVIRFTPKNLRCELSSSFDILSDSEERYFIFASASYVENENRKMRGKKHFEYKDFFTNEKKKEHSTIQQEMKSTDRESIFR